MLNVTLFYFEEMEDNIEQIKLDLQKFLYHLRLRAEVFVVPLVGNILTCCWMDYNYHLLIGC